MYRASEPLFCRRCGEKWSPGGESCAACGEPRDASPEASTPRPAFRSQTRRARTLAVLLAVNAVVLCVDIAFDLFEWSLMKESMMSHVDFEELTASDDRQLAISTVHLATFFATMVTFCTWLFEAGRNVRALGITDTRQTEEWRVVWFFVPVLNLFKPLLGIRELWRASTANDRRDWQQAKASPLVTAWWLVWTPGCSLMLVAWGMVFASATPTQLIHADQIGIAGAALRLLATPLLLGMVVAINRMQEERAASDPQVKHADTSA